MLEVFIYALPDIILMLGAAILCVLRFSFSVANPKQYFLWSKLTVCLAAVVSLVFYNKTFLPQMLQENSFTTMIKLIVYALSIAWYYVSFKWFVSKNISGFRYCTIILLMTECLCLLISVHNICLLNVVEVLMFFLIYNFMLSGYSIEINKKNILTVWIVCSAVSQISAAWLYYEAGTFSYDGIKNFLMQNPNNIQTVIACLCLLLPLMSLLMIFPLYFWNHGMAEQGILPVLGYVILILPPAVFSSLFVLLLQCFMPIYSYLQFPLMILAFLTMFFGALAANGENNLRKMFVYGTMYCNGVVLLIMSYMEAYAVFSAYVYMVISTLAMFGIYTCFYACKSRGEYQNNISDVAGLYKVLPYIASALLIFIFSLIGMPPLLGFLGSFYVINQLFSVGNYLMAVLVLVSLGILSDAYLRLIKSMYFAERNRTFDRADRGIYVSLFVNLILVMITLFNTSDVVKIAHDIIYKMF